MAFDNAQQNLEVRLTNTQLRPAGVLFKDLQKLIPNIETFFNYVEVEGLPARRPIPVSLTKIESGSVRYSITSSARQFTSVVAATAAVISSQAFTTLVPKARVALHELINFSAVHGCNIEFFDRAQNLTLATITQDLDLQDPLPVEERTTIYGVIRR